MPVERWLPIPSYEGEYEVSDHGRVWSLARLVRGKHWSGTWFMRRVPPRMLKPGTSGPFGHVTVSLGRYNSKCVHFLVALAFIGPRPPGYDVRHIDTDASNNHIDNLTYATRRRNNFDRAKNDKCKLSRSAVVEILSSDVSGAELARKYGVSNTYVCDIRNKKVRIYG